MEVLVGEIVCVVSMHLHLGWVVHVQSASHGPLEKPRVYPVEEVHQRGLPPPSGSRQVYLPGADRGWKVRIVASQHHETSPSSRGQVRMCHVSKVLCDEMADLNTILAKSQQVRSVHVIVGAKDHVGCQPPQRLGPVGDPLGSADGGDLEAGLDGGCDLEADLSYP